MKTLTVTVNYSSVNEVFEVDIPEEIGSENELDFVREAAENRDLDYLYGIGMYTEYDAEESIEICVDGVEQNVEGVDCDTDDEALWEDSEAYCVVERQNDTVIQYVFNFDDDVEFDINRLSVLGARKGAAYYIGEPDECGSVCPRDFSSDTEGVIFPSDYDIVSSGDGGIYAIYKDGDLIEEL